MVYLQAALVVNVFYGAWPGIAVLYRAVFRTRV
jgi:hypothetical protein